MRELDRRLLRSSRVAQAHLLVAIALGFVTAVAVVAQAVLLARVVSRVFLDGADLGDVQAELVALVAVAVGRGVASWGFEASGQVGAARVMSDLRSRLVRRIAAGRPSGLEEEQSGEIAAAAVQGVDALQSYFARYLPQLALAVLVPLAVLGWVFTIDVVAAAIMAGTLPLIPVFMILIGRLAERRSRERLRALSLLSGRFLDAVRGLPTLRAFGRADDEARALAAVGDRYRRETMGTLRIAFLSALVLELAAMLSTGMIAVVLGVRLADGGLRLEDALTVLILAPELYLPLRQLGAQFHSAADGLAAAGRIFELVEVPGEVGRASWSEHVPDPRSSTIRLEGVDFTYPARHNLVLDGVDLELRPGELLALVGPSGVGKSTVAALLLRLVEPTSGRITVGGRDLRDVDVDRWRAGLAWLPQRPHIFAGSVAQNIRIADPSASDDRLLAAVAAAGAAFVHALQQGIDTRIGDGGRPLSAGETRRIGLARALLRDAPLLILDEPTAHLDRESAWSVAASVRQIARGKTTLLITHDEALARLADRAVSIGLPAPGLLEAA